MPGITISPIKRRQIIAEIRIEFRHSATLDEAISAATSIASTTGAPVRFTFNGLRITAEPDDILTADLDK